MDFLEHKLFDPIVKLVAVTIGAIGLLVNIFTKNVDLPGMLFPIILLVLIIALIITQYNSSRKNQRLTKRAESLAESIGTITALASLQSAFIRTPIYVTSEQHGEHSKEKDLKQDGTAEILTNSLSYDCFFASEIADNISQKAKYHYYLPCKRSALEELTNYINLLFSNLHTILSNSNSGAVSVDESVRKIMKDYLSFSFFEEDMLSLYNFADFRQIASKDASERFTQAWWYINPQDESPDSYMVAVELDDADRTTLLNVLQAIGTSSTELDGWVVYENRRDIRPLLPLISKRRATN
jgi:hypothetical protein